MRARLNSPSASPSGREDLGVRVAAHRAIPIPRSDGCREVAPRTSGNVAGGAVGALPFRRDQTARWPLSRPRGGSAPELAPPSRVPFIGLESHRGFGSNLILEGFAERGYSYNGSLIPRGQPERSSRSQKGGPAGVRACPARRNDLHPRRFAKRGRDRPRGASGTRKGGLRGRRMRLRLVSLYGDLRHVPLLKGMRRFGVPPGGPADAESAALAAALGGAPPNSVVELAFGEATFAVEEGGNLAVVGAGRRSAWPFSGRDPQARAQRRRSVALASPGGWTLRPSVPIPESRSLSAPGDALDGRSRRVVAPHAFTLPPIAKAGGDSSGRGASARSLDGDEARSSPSRRISIVTGSVSAAHRSTVSRSPANRACRVSSSGRPAENSSPSAPTDRRSEAIRSRSSPSPPISRNLGSCSPARTVRLVEITLEAAREANRAREAELARRLLMIRLAG